MTLCIIDMQENFSAAEDIINQVRKHAIDARENQDFHRLLRLFRCLDAAKAMLEAAGYTVKEP